MNLFKVVLKIIDAYVAAFVTAEMAQEQKNA